MKRAKIGSVEFSVIESENPQNNLEITEKPVENGQDVADHGKLKPPTISLTGVIVGTDASSKLAQLKKYQKEVRLLKFVGRTSYDNMVIESLSTIHDTETSNGFKFTINLKQVRIATAKDVSITVVNPQTKKPSKKTNTQVKKKTNNGKQQPKTKTMSNTIAPTSPVLTAPALERMRKEVRSPGNRMKTIVSIYNPPPKTNRMAAK